MKLVQFDTGEGERPAGDPALVTLRVTIRLWHAPC